MKKKKAKINNISVSQYQVDWVAETIRIIQLIRETGVMAICIDLFCGFGGTTTGAEKALFMAQKMILVILGINHDDVALACHKVHNKHTLHLKEDIRDVQLEPIAKMIEAIRKEFPWLKIFLWCSAECTNISLAKGGKSRDADSRTLAEELFRYEEAIKPDVIQVENVVEWRSCGPLKHKQIRMRKVLGKVWRFKLRTKYGTLYSKEEKNWVNPKSGLCYQNEKKKGISPWMIAIPERKSEIFNAWKNTLISRGYKYEDRNINAADHGAYTSRKRYYGQFSKSMPIMWPEATHTKDPDKHFKETGKLLLKHKPVREVLELQDVGESIFSKTRKKKLKDPTLKRLYEWLIREEHKGEDRFGRFLSAYHGNGHNCRSVEDPSPVIPTNDSVALVTPFIMRDFSRTTNTGLDRPVGALTRIPKVNLVQPQYSEFHLMNLYQYGGRGSVSVDKSCFTLIARMDKAPPYLMAIDGGISLIKILKTDTKHAVLIKTFMIKNGIIDIRMRMLKETELLPIQGFDPDHLQKVRAMGIKVTSENAKKYIGNSQEVTTAKCMYEAYGPYLLPLKEQYLKNAA